MWQMTGKLLGAIGGRARQRNHLRQRRVTVCLGQAREAWLNEARLAVRLGYFDEARRIINCSPWGRTDPAYINLGGAIHELHGQWRQAGECYRKALRADRGFSTAEQNLRRLYELTTFGRTALRLVMGDERPALQALLEARDIAIGSGGGRIVSRLERFQWE